MYSTSRCLGLLTRGLIILLTCKPCISFSPKLSSASRIRCCNSSLEKSMSLKNQEDSTSLRNQEEDSTSLKIEEDPNQEDFYIFEDTVTILDRGEHHVVVSKPPSVVCHHSEWTGSRSSKKGNQPPEVPMLQRTREALSERVNLIHRLDRGASGCLLLSLCRSDKEGNRATALLQEGMTMANKTYVALVRGEGILRGEDMKKKGWFEVSRPIKDEKGILQDATTSFRFVAGQDNDSGNLDRPRASLVLARPTTGRWHQIRRHLNGLSHPILGDSSHGNSKVNREWRQKRGLPLERICLHLMDLSLPPTTVCPNGIKVSCPLPHDMMEILEDHLPNVLRDAIPILQEEGYDIEAVEDVTPTTIPIKMKL